MSTRNQTEILSELDQLSEENLEILENFHDQIHMISRVGAAPSQDTLVRAICRHVMVELLKRKASISLLMATKGDGDECR